MSSKKTKQQKKEDDRKRREEERAKRDAERAKKRLALRAVLRAKIVERKEVKIKNEAPKSSLQVTEAEKEQRRTVLQYRRAQSRFALPKISESDDMEDIIKANAELQKSEEEDSDSDAADHAQTNGDQDDQKEIPASSSGQHPQAETQTQTQSSSSAAAAASANNTQSTDGDVDNSASVHSVEELVLSEAQETALETLTNDSEAIDVDFYGFVDYNQFLQILKKHEINLSMKQESYLSKALTLIDEGVDYYAFARKIREVGRTLQPDNTLQDICEEIADDMEKKEQKAEKSKQALPTTDLSEMNSADIANVDEDSAEFEAFLKQTIQHRGRGMSLLRMDKATQQVGKGSDLGQLIDDLALDGADVDFALLKTALSTIDCHPSDKDMKLIIDHLCADGSGFVDFNYLITFLQQTYGAPAKKWSRIEKVISKVAEQLRMLQRAEERKQKQQEKLMVRLEQQRKSRLGKKNDDDMVKKNDDDKEQKRKSALGRRKKALFNFK